MTFLYRDSKTFIPYYAKKKVRLPQNPQSSISYSPNSRAVALQIRSDQDSARAEDSVKFLFAKQQPDRKEDNGKADREEKIGKFGSSFCSPSVYIGTPIP